MPLHILDDKIWFPTVDDALDDGLLAAGGTISVERLLLAYKKGIFPWYDGDIPLWWSPDPRFVLFPENLKISKSMRPLLNRSAYKFTMNKAFDQVIKSCKEKPRQGQDGTWITEDVEHAFNQLHQQGYGISAEAWQGDQLVGGLYGIKLGNIFFGESMFSHVSNASKYAFIKLVEKLKKNGVKLIDCQVHTEHLQSLGAEMITRKDFIRILKAEL